jgi:hypothetical protein
MENKINFLNIAISDAQELIRFIDTKTAIVITILGAYVFFFFTSLDKIIEYSFGYSCWFWFFLTAFFVLLTLCIIVTARIITPTNNPSDNINFGSAAKPTLNFFVTPNDYPKGFLYSFANSKELKLKENFETYSQQLRTSTDSDIISSLTLELFKVSFTRNIKNDRFNILLWLLVVTTISFFAAHLFFSIETHNTHEQLKNIHGHCCGK